MSNFLVNKNNNVFDWMDPFFDGFFSHDNSANGLMRTDITDEGDHYQLRIDMPAVKKENIKIFLADGYMTVQVNYSENSEEKKMGKYLRRERQYGSYSRTYYVGDSINDEDIKAKLEDGVLTLNLAKPVEPEKKGKKYIEIE